MNRPMEKEVTKSVSDEVQEMLKYRAEFKKFQAEKREKRNAQWTEVHHWMTQTCGPRTRVWLEADGQESLYTLFERQSYNDEFKPLQTSLGHPIYGYSRLGKKYPRIHSWRYMWTGGSKFGCGGYYHLSWESYQLTVWAERLSDPIQYKLWYDALFHFLPVRGLTEIPLQFLLLKT